jgi:phage-related protein
MREVLFFKRPDGTSPVEEFIDALTDKQARKVAWVPGFESGGRFVVLTNAFAKKTQKTPRNEIALAEQRKKYHLKENKK